MKLLEYQEVITLILLYCKPIIHIIIAEQLPQFHGNRTLY